MTFEELLASVKGSDPPKDDLLRAMWLAKKGDWNGAHNLVSEISTAMASRIHAHLHRVEGDLSNAGYWYRQAGVKPESGTLEAEWESIVRDLLKGH
jgi:hypothetical protein